MAVGSLTILPQGETAAEWIESVWPCRTVTHALAAMSALRAASFAAASCSAPGNACHITA